MTDKPRYIAHAMEFDMFQRTIPTALLELDDDNVYKQVAQFDEKRGDLAARVADLLNEHNTPDEPEIDPGDLRVEVFRTAPQSVLEKDSAVRITHIPTGIFASGVDGKSQLENRELAMRGLRERLKAYEERNKTLQPKQNVAIDPEELAEIVGELQGEVDRNKAFLESEELQPMPHEHALHRGTEILASLL